MDDRSLAPLTFLFTGIECSTRLWERFPDPMKGALSRHDAILRGAIEAADGRVVRTTGDGMMAVFARASDAVDASLAAQRGLAREPWPDTGPLRVRMGLRMTQLRAATRLGRLWLSDDEAEAAAVESAG